VRTLHVELDAEEEVTSSQKVVVTDDVDECISNDDVDVNSVTELLLS